MINVVLDAHDLNESFKFIYKKIKEPWKNEN